MRLRCVTIEHGVLGVECSNHSVPTIFFNDLVRFLKNRAFLCQGLLRDFFHPAILLSIVSAGPRESVAEILLASSISLPSSAAE